MSSISSLTTPQCLLIRWSDRIKLSGSINMPFWLGSWILFNLKKKSGQLAWSLSFMTETKFKTISSNKTLSCLISPKPLLSNWKNKILFSKIPKRKELQAKNNQKRKKPKSKPKKIPRKKMAKSQTQSCPSRSKLSVTTMESLCSL